MKLGQEECVEVWFVPSNCEAYAPREIAVFASVDYAREYIEAEAVKYAGLLEMVRVTSTRQRVA